MKYPAMVRVRQCIDCPQVLEVAPIVKEELHKVRLDQSVRPGMRVAITAGSRGIAALPEVISTTAEEVRALQAQPFIVPAMGSHGGATVQGQLGVLHSLGITEARIGAPILASMDTVKLGYTEDGLPVHMDKHAYSADAIILINRIKVHSPWGEIGSGLQKMAAIGLGKQRGCTAIHSWSKGTRNLYRNIQKAAAVVLEKAPVVAGIGIVDNTHALPAKIVGLTPHEIPFVEPVLLGEARRLVARLPFNDLDLLIVERIGKNISPAGLDPLVVGIPGNPNSAEGLPRIHRIVILGLTPESYGNALGINAADYTTSRCVGQIDYGVMYVNVTSADGIITRLDLLKARTLGLILSAFSRHAPAAGRYAFYQLWRALRSRSPRPIRLPARAASDRAAIEGALHTLVAGKSMDELRVARIRDTLHLDEFWVSSHLAAGRGPSSNLEVLGPPEPLRFDARGNLI